MTLSVRLSRINQPVNISKTTATARVTQTGMRAAKKNPSAMKIVSMAEFRMLSPL
ncbi:hypothetical protein D3C80_2106130 [compost metagenome]